jgi:hypothetical protein
MGLAACRAWTRATTRSSPRRVVGQRPVALGALAADLLVAWADPRARDGLASAPAAAARCRRARPPLRARAPSLRRRAPRRALHARGTRRRCAWRCCRSVALRRAARAARRAVRPRAAARRGRAQQPGAVAAPPARGPTRTSRDSSARVMRGARVSLAVGCSPRSPRRGVGTAWGASRGSARRRRAASCASWTWRSPCRACSLLLVVSLWGACPRRAGCLRGSRWLGTSRLVRAHVRAARARLSPARGRSAPRRAAAVRTCPARARHARGQRSLIFGEVDRGRGRALVPRDSACGRPRRVGGA